MVTAEKNIRLCFDQSEGHCKHEDVTCKPSSFKYF